MIIVTCTYTQQMSIIHTHIDKYVYNRYYKHSSSQIVIIE